MKGEELDRLEELEKAATPGDWVYEHGPGDMDVGVPESFDVLAQNGDALCSMFTFDRKVSEANARLIPALRNAAPALIAAARALNKACEDREKAEKWWSDLHGICIDGRNKLAAENAKLRAVVEAARKLVSDGEDIEVLAAALSALGAKGVE